ncbi:hypothetical protein [Mangrovicella endophytica]|uniref:hypothetical protein n=1 Tax=Mangrovicella endophytica TaxID=2066697 RepID=UPI0012FFFE72|nr:hypothetical protein [Mangrovicella endophytica]
MVTRDSGSGDGDLSDPAVLSGVADTTITENADRTELSLTSPGLVSSFTGTNDGSSEGRFYALPNGGRALVSRVNVADGVDDTFLVYSEYNPTNEQQTEFAYSYAGTRSTDDTMARLKANNHTATYVGSGQVTGAMGSQEVSIFGRMGMDVNFAGSGSAIDGNIVDTSGRTGLAADEMTFNGELSEAGTSDFDITNIRLHNGGSEVATIDPNADSIGAGVGSFFGRDAEGVIGVFAGSGRTVVPDGATGERVNIIGSFSGSAATATATRR